MTHDASVLERQCRSVCSLSRWRVAPPSAARPMNSRSAGSKATVQARLDSSGVGRLVHVLAVQVETRFQPQRVSCAKTCRTNARRREGVPQPGGIRVGQHDLHAVLSRIGRVRAIIQPCVGSMERTASGVRWRLGAGNFKGMESPALGDPGKAGRLCEQRHGVGTLHGDHGDVIPLDPHGCRSVQARATYQAMTLSRVAALETTR